MKKEEMFLRNLFQNFKQVDPFFIRLTKVLVITGIVFAFSSSTYESYRLTHNFWTLGVKQLMALTIGFSLLILLVNLNFKFWYKSTWFFSLIMLLLMTVMLFTPLGKTSGGSQRWLEISFIYFQPAELIKFTVILLVSRFLTKYHWSKFKSYYYLILILVLTLLVLKQPDLGSALILFLLLFEMLFIFGFPVGILLLLIFCISLFVYVKIQTTPYQLDRIYFWLNPELDPQGKGYNLIQSKYALAFGGLFGVGLGNSIQKQGFLPIPHSDFIFSIIAEEIGFIGTLAILILFITWILRGLYLINKVNNKYGRILGSGIIFLISTQVMVNIAVNVGLLPITGVTLPFFSCGGTSEIVSLAMCGVLFNILHSENTKQNIQTITKPTDKGVS